MKTYHALAWKQIKTQKMTSILILIAIVLSTMTTTVIGQSLGILQALREQQAGGLNGYRYATFHNITEQQKSLVEKDSRLSFVGSHITLGISKLMTSGMNLQLREYDDMGLSIYPNLSQIQEGRLPQKAGEIALPEDALQFLGFSGNLGDTVTLDMNIALLQSTEPADEYQADFTLVGVLKSHYVGYGTGTITGIAGEGSAAALLPDQYQVYSTDFRTSKKQGFQQTVDDLVDELGIDDNQIQYNWLYLNALGISYEEGNDSSEDSGFSYMTAAGILIGVLVLLAAGLVIYNILKIVVSKRLKEYGTLRAIGAQKDQLYRLVSEQILLLCLPGIPLGTLLGIASAGAMTKAATGFFSPQIFMAQNAEALGVWIAQNSTSKPLPLLYSTAITLGFAFIAAIPAARNAAGVSPTVAMRGITGKIKRKRRKDKPIRHFEAFYARQNLKRNAGRTAITILSLVMSISVFVALQSFSGLLDAAQDVRKFYLGDYSITHDGAGFDSSVVEDLKNHEGVSAVATLKYSLYMQDQAGNLPIATDFALKPGEALHIAGVDEERLKTLAPTLTNEDLRALKNGEACLIVNPIPMSYQGKLMEASSFSAGDQVTVASTELNVLGNTAAVGLNNEGFVNGIQVVVFDTVYDRLTGKTTYSELYPRLEDGADAQAVEQKIERITDEAPGSRWLSYRNVDKQLEESFEQIKLLAWGVIFFISLIGVLNIINTTYTNIHTRIGEIGVQRAIGMSKASLYKTFLWEGVYYGMIAAVIGAVVGYICTIFIGAAATDRLEFAALPMMPIVQAAFASIGACLIATCIPLRQIAKRSIVDCMDTVE